MYKVVFIILLLLCGGFVAYANSENYFLIKTDRHVVSVGEEIDVEFIFDIKNVSIKNFQVKALSKNSTISIYDEYDKAWKVSNVMYIPLSKAAKIKFLEFTGDKAEVQFEIVETTKKNVFKTNSIEIFSTQKDIRYINSLNGLLLATPEIVESTVSESAPISLGSISENSPAQLMSFRTFLSKLMETKLIFLIIGVAGFFAGILGWFFWKRLKNGKITQ